MAIYIFFFQCLSLSVFVLWHVCACMCVSTVLDLLCGLLELRMNLNSIACSVWIAGRTFLAPVAS